MQKLSNHTVANDLVEDSDICEIRINRSLKKLHITTTILYRGRSTESNIPVGKEHVCYFFQGTGVVLADNQTYRVNVGSVLLLPETTTYQIVNDGEMNLMYNTIIGN